MRGPQRGPLYPPGYPPYAPGYPPYSPGYAAPYAPGYTTPYTAPYANPAESCVLEVNGTTDVYVIAVDGVPVSPAIVCAP